MRLGWPLKAVLEIDVEQAERSRVDCGTCPVSIQCAAGEGGNGWKFDCCGATAVHVDGLLLVMDCANNQFNKTEKTRGLKCPLCGSDVMESYARGIADDHRWVPTVHAKVPIKTRLDAWRERYSKAIALVSKERERKNEAG